MEFQEEVAQLLILKKQTLQKIIGFGTQYLNNWTECLEMTQELKLLKDRQRQRFKDGFSLNNHPSNKPGYHSLNENTQFEQRQIFEKLVFENQTDEQENNRLELELSKAKMRATVSWQSVVELQSAFENLSQIAMDVEEEQAEP